MPSFVSPPAPPPALPARLLLPLALAQGLALALLHGAVEQGVEPWNRPPLLLALYAVTLVLPVTLGLLSGRVGPLAVLARAAGVALAMAGCAAYTGWVVSPLDGRWPAQGGSVFFLGLALGAAWFVALPFLVTGWRGTTRAEGYARLHDEAWANLASLALAFAFAGLAWALVGLFVGLFGAIGLSWPREWLLRRWFAYPFSCAAFAFALMLGRFRPELVAAVRRIVLLVLRWLAPLAQAVLVMFALALLFQGVQPLWHTRMAAGLLLSLGFALVALDNVVWQDLAHEPAQAAPLAWLQRLATWVAPALPALAAWAFALRIGQYGLTEDRAFGLIACLLLAGYAGGYAFATLPADAEARLAWRRRVNLGGAAAMVALALAVHSPLLDLKRMTAASQSARIGAKAEDSELRYLRHESGRHGLAALGRIAADPAHPGHQRAADALAWSDHSRLLGPERRPVEQAAVTREQFAARFELRPAGAGLPPLLLGQWHDQLRAKGWDAPCVHTFGDTAPRCVARLADLDGDGADEVLVVTVGYGAIEVWGQPAPGRHWRRVGRLQVVKADGAALLRSDDWKLAPPPRYRGLVMGGEVREFVPE
ncbi:DUF4153 domain-containing protein [Derxia gummosa]|uniref:DUF4153 domain-containing protein n=1 Tax=Derxia gummosa DSM 723 TaxID=1121388 RepID=A0A8B6XD38_9BURK|nr:DUF4153 domain-containing protein [Derxia gummosa]